ncbi:MAG TPA: hypothetical protein VGQ99_12145, partial [Tepidisphaeraceae bacterium]|nr:hypothetical protein [Tepidisphaeraceae bacterium]
MRLVAFCCVCLCSSLCLASVYNLKTVTDASPDYSDLPSLVHSATSKWNTPEEKCWAIFYWNHIARRQTNPIELHGMALTDPIRQFNDYGYTMCSTISGINQSIWEQMGLKHRYWDISNHTVSEVFYDGRWHMYDNSLSALYTLCDGKTLAGVEDIGKEGACEKSANKKEPGHIAKYHCLTSTSPNGFLTGADTIRSLDEEYRCFNPNGLKLRTYFYDWDYGHRYIHNLRPGDQYTRLFTSGEQPEDFIPNSNGKDPEEVNPRYHLRGNGSFNFTPNLKDEKEFKRIVHAADNVAISPGPDGGLGVLGDAPRGTVIFKVATPNVMTSMRMVIFPEIAVRSVNCFCSTDNGHTWTQFKPDPTPFADPNIFIPAVTGSYEALIKLELNRDVVLKNVAFFGTTALNSKTLPRLNLGRNTIYVGAGEQTDSIVLWPELHGDKYKQMIVEERNVGSTKKHNGYQGTLYPTKAKEDGYIVYRIDAPRDLTRLTYGGRFYNRAPKSHIDLLHSLDNGQTWTKSWFLTDTAQPWDVIHYETVQIPAGCRSVLVKYLMNSPSPSHDACSIYA